MGSKIPQPPPVGSQNQWENVPLPPPKPHETSGDYFARTGIKPTKVEVLRVQPGDVLVLTTARPLNALQREQIGVNWHKAFGVRVIVLTEGDSLRVMRQEEA